jgi:hypothetical protein
MCLGGLPVTQARAGEADLAALGDEDRAVWCAAACARAGLDPAERPFVIWQSLGREAPVAVAESAVRMAVSHGLSLHTVEGPETTVIDGVVLVRVVCRATAPDGRVEVATATVPWVHPTRSAALCVNRAKARATLALLGIAALDESDLAAFAGRESSHLKGTPHGARRIS